MPSEQNLTAKSVFIHVINEHVFQLKQKKTIAWKYSSILGGLVEDTNMAAVPFLRDTKMAAMTSRENTEYFCSLQSRYHQSISSIQISSL